MKQQIKQWMKKGLTKRQIRQYEKLLEQKTVTYDVWIRGTEQTWNAEDLTNAKKASKTVIPADGKVRYIPYEACRDYVTGNGMQSDEAEVVLFADDDGQVSEIAERVTAEFFACHADVALAYGDEDVMSPEGIRYTPWLKPDWSPDTYLSFFYFGSVFAVRMKALRALTSQEKQWIWEAGERNGIYRMCFVLVVKNGGFMQRKDGFPIGHIDEILFHSRTNRELQLENSPVQDWSKCPVTDGLSMIDGWNRERTGNVPMISIIIPSKDNPEILKQCIMSLQRDLGSQRVGEGVSGVDGKGANQTECNAGLQYEVIVVDNGSTEAVKQELESWLSEQGSNYQYIYQPMPFHFSMMCNIGAEAAGGKVLLFLNDDVEIPEHFSVGEHLSVAEMLYQTALRPFTGAVGVKLYYPDSKRIQHAGIVNLRLGPVHKLQFKEDDRSYYYSWNLRRRNVIAVTGACLAVEKKKFEEIGGFSEELPVAFNDVDVCFSLYEKGYYNVVLQDIALFHHESLSRGNDDDREKLNRLLGEKDKLYERHPKLCGHDPFYHKYFANDMLSTGFELRSDYDGKPQLVQGKVKAQKGLLADARQDACVIISLEYADRYLLQGYSFVTGSDNACFEKYIIFRPDTETEDGLETIRYVKAEPFIRKDVEDNLPDQVNVGMTGFNMELSAGDLPVGSYRVGVMVKDKCSGQKIYAWTNRYLVVE